MQLTLEGSAVTVSDTDIALPADKNTRFGSQLPTYVNPRRVPDLNDSLVTSLAGGGVVNPERPLNTDERLMIWMRVAPLPT